MPEFAPLSPQVRFSVGLALTATGMALIVLAIQSFDHGIWLVAYLLLVGVVAQYLLARGQSDFAPAASSGTVRAELILWNLGLVLVPFGVLAGFRSLVAIGSLVLIAALAIFWRTVGPWMHDASPRRTRTLARGYVLLLLFMLVSVVTGFMLSSDVPW